LVAKSTTVNSAWAQAIPKAECPTNKLTESCKNLSDLLGNADYWKEKGKISSAIKDLTEEDLGALQMQADSALGWSASSDDERQFKLLDRCNTYISTVPTIRSLVSEVRAAEQIHKITNGLFEEAVNIRKRECARMFRDIGSDIKKIYDWFHPDEPLGEFSLELKDKGEGSAILLGGFGDRVDEDPRAYYSEAHQDTLGLAIFLSLHQRRTTGTNFNLLILDDILTSVDAAHRRRVAEYLLEQVRQGTQIILTTHSRPWFEWLLKIQADKGIREAFVNKRIVDWTLEDGPIIDDPEGDYDVLQNGLGNKAHEQLLPIAGRLLEEILHNMRFGLSLAVSAKPGEQYTIGDIFPTFNKKLSEFPGLLEDLKYICDQLKSTWGIRNWSTHYNEWALELSGEEAKQFIMPVMSLYQKTFCPKCRSFIFKSDTDVGATRCKKGCLVYRKIPVS
jgi:hypothetical protein